MATLLLTRADVEALLDPALTALTRTSLDLTNGMAYEPAAGRSSTIFR